MTMLYDRTPYLNAVKSQVEQHIFYHSLAVEACMGALYEYLSSHKQLGNSEPPKEEWVLAGLVHDIDYSDPWKEEHPKKTKEALQKYGLVIPESTVTIIQAHAPEQTQVQPTSKAQWSLFCMDSLTGLIMAVAYVYPSRKLADVKVSSVLKRFLKEPKFAAGTRRSEVAECSNPDGLNIPIETFIEICLTAMQSIADTMGV